MTDSYWGRTPLLKSQWTESLKAWTHWDSGTNWLHHEIVLARWLESTTNRSTTLTQESSQPITVKLTHMWVLGQGTSHPTLSAVSCAAIPGHFRRVPTVSHQKLPTLLACFPPASCKAATPLVNQLTIEQQYIVIKIGWLCGYSQYVQFPNPFMSETKALDAQCSTLALASSAALEDSLHWCI